MRRFPPKWRRRFWRWHDRAADALTPTEVVSTVRRLWKWVGPTLLVIVVLSLALKLIPGGEGAADVLTAIWLYAGLATVFAVMAAALWVSFKTGDWDI